MRDNLINANPPDSAPAAISAMFHWNIRVYYEDTDAGGIVFYANYLKFFERARTEWLRQANVGQQELATTHGVMFVVKSTSIDYRAPAKLDDQLRITTIIEKLGRASIEFSQEAWCGDRLLVTGRILVACVDVKTIRPAAIPSDMLFKIRQPT